MGEKGGGAKMRHEIGILGRAGIPRVVIVIIRREGDVGKQEWPITVGGRDNDDT